MQLPQKQQTFSQFFFYIKFWIFWKNVHPQSFYVSNITDSEKVVR